MDLMEKINTLLSAAVNAKLPHRERRSALEQLEQEQLASIRQALAEVELRERNMAERLQNEQAKAAEAAQSGDQAEQRDEQVQQTNVRRDVEQQDEARSPHQIDAAQQGGAMHAVAKISRQNHSTQVDGRQHPVGRRARQQRKAAEGRIGQEVGFDHTRRREAAD